MKNLRNLPFLKMFMPKRRNKGTLWASLFGLGISAVVYGMKKGRGREFADPIANTVKKLTPNVNMERIGNITKNITPNLNVDHMNNAALAEFSEELMESALNNNK
ncbi:hypothetical protein [Neobacillus sp. LXY-1]|uniref:hypothetical protein n=1 Tax=Neobacillus sp. LXY-1 TaxID=3379133 RepID=UPI003EE02AF5